jgi:hypothetical protein
MYIIGSVSWVIVVFGALEGAISPTSWSTRDLLLGIFLCLVVFPSSIVLMAAVARGYNTSRVAISLLSPPPIMLVGVLTMPGNLAPFSVAIAALISIGSVICLLQFWACDPDVPLKKVHQ